MTEQTKEQAQQEREALKHKANMLGITLQGNQSNETIRALIQAKLNEAAAEATQTNPAEDAAPVVQPMAKRTPTLREYVTARDLALVRCKISNLDPKKSKIQGDYFTVANEYIGSVTKWIPFTHEACGENGFHIPHCLYEMLKNRRYLQVKEKMINGVPTPVTEDVLEFSIEVLPQLTPAELKELQALQAATGTLSLKD